MKKKDYLRLKKEFNRRHSYYKKFIKVISARRGIKCATYIEDVNNGYKKQIKTLNYIWRLGK